MLRLELAGILALGLASLGALALYLVQRPPAQLYRVAAGPGGTLTTMTAVPAPTTVPFVAGRPARILPLGRQATARGITVRMAVVGGISPARLILLFGPLPARTGVGGTGEAMMTDGSGHPIPMSGNGQGVCDRMATYPVRCTLGSDFAWRSRGTHLVLTIPRLLINRYPMIHGHPPKVKSFTPYWVTGPWKLSLTMP